MFLGIDISTIGAKALLIDESGKVISSAITPVTLSTPRPLWSEQEPQEWWHGVTASVRMALGKANVRGADVKAIGLTGQMHGLVLLDESGEVLRPAILWNDQRCGAECDEIRNRLGRGRLIEITGNDALTGFTAPKVLWVKNHEPDVYARVRYALLPKDYIRYKLTDHLAMDKADGSGTILFDLKTRDWSGTVLDALGIPRQWLPMTFEGPEVTGEVGSDAAEETGLRAGTPVMAGGGDQSAQAVGVGAVRPGIAALTLGTSGVIFATTERALIEPEGRLHAFCHASPGRWHLMGVMLSAAGSLQWHRDMLAPQTNLETLAEEAGEIPAGSEGLIFLPYLTGERTPYADPLARAAWVGLTIRHTRGHMTRAIMEGVAFGLKDSFTLIQGAGLVGINQVRTSGGGSKSRFWKQILADVLGTELIMMSTTEGAAYGAALLAGVGLGVWPDVEAACDAAVKIVGCVSPDELNERVYGEMYDHYRALYPTLKTTFNKLSTIE
jgi:xylulokinase